MQNYFIILFCFLFFLFRHNEEQSESAAKKQKTTNNSLTINEDELEQPTHDNNETTASEQQVVSPTNITNLPSGSKIKGRFSQARLEMLEKQRIEAEKAKANKPNGEEEEEQTEKFYVYFDLIDYHLPIQTIPKDEDSTKQWNLQEGDIALSVKFFITFSPFIHCQFFFFFVFKKCIGSTATALIGGRVFKGDLTPIPGTMVFFDKNPSDGSLRIHPEIPPLRSYIPLRRMKVNDKEKKEKEKEKEKAAKSSSTTTTSSSSLEVNTKPKAQPKKKNPLKLALEKMKKKFGDLPDHALDAQAKAKVFRDRLNDAVEAGQTENKTLMDEVEAFFTETKNLSISKKK